ncbi:hypothetical protein MO973_21295 [Paenibacillus sp. TRM 82003]|nr:hypothetical protein [Paenibacillus sp. TRM 82003]
MSGFALGFFLKLVEAATGSKVYILLLNVDFVPGLPQPLPEWFEFALHLVVSVIIGSVYAALLYRFPAVRRRPIAAGIVAGLSAVPLFYPLTALSERTPAPDDLTALAWWIAGHLLYGIVLGIYGWALARRS